MEDLTKVIITVIIIIVVICVVAGGDTKIFGFPVGIASFLLLRALWREE